MTNLTLELAMKCLEAAKSEAEKLRVKCTIAVVDTGGHLITLSRMDGAGFMTINIAVGLAFTAVSFQSPTKDMEWLFVRNTQILQSLSAKVPGMLVWSKGGIPLFDGDRCIGGIGISGGTADQDYQIASAAQTFLIHSATN